MKTIETKIDKELSSVDTMGKNPCFLDIETTGLSRYKSFIYLIGILYYDNTKESWILKQFFMDNPQEEKLLLKNVMDYISKFDVIINYNGDSFDIPFINYRLEIYGLDTSIPKEKSLDLYSIIRKNSYLFELPNLKLKTIENFLGINREDIFSGRDCINFYNQYIVNKDPILEERILRHNHDDLYYLIDIIVILDMIKDKKSFNILCDKEELRFHIDDVKTIKDFLSISGSIDGNVSNKIIYYGDNYKILISPDRLFELSLEIKRGLITPEKKCLFINRKDYLIEDSMIWKSDYKTPKDIILLDVDGKYYIENIKKVIFHLLNEIII